MAELIVFLPAVIRRDASVQWALVNDGRMQQSGQASLSSAQLTRLGASRWIGVVPPEVVTVFPCDLPALSGAKLSAALRGALEERLLETSKDSGLVAGAVINGRITQAAALEQAWPKQLSALKLPFVKLIPALCLLKPGHARLLGNQVFLHSAQGELAALPAALAPSQGYIFDEEVSLQSDALAAAQHNFNLLTGELAAAGGALQAGKYAQAALAAGWANGWIRPLVYGLIALTIVGLLGLQAKAMQLSNQLKDRRAVQAEITRKALPGVPLVDPVLQLNSALKRARVESGEKAPGDLEALLSVANSTLGGGATWQQISYARESLSIETAQTVSAEQIQSAQARGYVVARDGARLSFTVKP